MAAAPVGWAAGEQGTQRGRAKRVAAGGCRLSGGFLEALGNQQDPEGIPGNWAQSWGVLRALRVCPGAGGPPRPLILTLAYIPGLTHLALGRGLCFLSLSFFICKRGASHAAHGASGGENPKPCWTPGGLARGWGHPPRPLPMANDTTRRKPSSTGNSNCPALR